ncbi:hypothetical protein [Rhodovulum sulfidophilum]|uniref:hypothetical protein n=1 Tax=Rhodovulum sulfidophilum TaxID=35806 RepID=UPI0009511A3F|nr:hypothetical protein [Rhodovulum sulfidophilum]OLS51880.1 hypothetical protein BV392_07585 [Rhodovulum sulfidophilum]
MTTKNQFTVLLSSGKRVTLTTDYKPLEARFTSPDGTWFALMQRDGVREAPNVRLEASESYPGLSHEETCEVTDTIFGGRGFLSWIDPEAPEFRTP